MSIFFTESIINKIIFLQEQKNSTHKLYFKPLLKIYKKIFKNELVNMFLFFVHVFFYKRVLYFYFDTFKKMCF